MTKAVHKFGSHYLGAERRSGTGIGTISRNAIDRRCLSLDWIPLFKQADQGELIAALSDCEVIELSAGETLLEPGQLNQDVFILLSGELAAHFDFGNSPESSISIPPGECIGELSALDGKPVSILVTAAESVRLLKIPQDIFWSRLMSAPGVAASMRIMLGNRIRRSNDMIRESQRRQSELQHLKKELGIARQLQQTMLPLQRPLFPLRHDLEISGFMEPASNVGGDLFDAFFVDKNQLFFCIGDVSGHGIASAMFMARTIGLIRVLAMSTPEPQVLMNLLNERLCTGNDTNIFVTLFCGLLDVSTGQFRYCNGGHCEPIVVRGDSATFLPVLKGPLVGAFSGVVYRALETTLKLDETLFCYTDGVTEAQKPNGEEFTESKCVTLIERESSRPIAELLDTVRRSVAEFTGTEVLEDDCTMLALRRRTVPS
ncbi:MAG: SpoIIE family protein phosphatase [Rhodoferax sp.]|nr:SpoIIE family protein phosphatase [Rhodoferax sp.]